MKICPTCKEEFLDHITSCVSCDKNLVEEHELALVPQNILSKEEFLQSETVVFTEGVLQQCREMEKILSKALVPCAVFPVSLDTKEPSLDKFQAKAAIGSTQDMRYCLLVRLEDIELAQKALAGHFHDQVIKEGQGKLVTHVVDLGQE